MDDICLRYYGDPILRTRCREVEEITDEIRDFVEQMKKVMIESNGQGLAAPQLGQDIRIFTTTMWEESADGKWGPGPIKVFINPVLSAPSDEVEIEQEGCLSFPGFRVDVDRPIQITVEWMDLEGKYHKETFEDNEARCCMHENDHLNGVLHIDRTSKRERQRVDVYLRDLKKRYKKEQKKRLKK
ncbi:MAG: peptide deformylase [Waddliaceae bacterium]|nr:peptide deformylase [Waddliaceae bacterium]